MRESRVRGHASRAGCTSKDLGPCAPQRQGAVPGDSLIDLMPQGQREACFKFGAQMAGQGLQPVVRGPAGAAPQSGGVRGWLGTGGRRERVVEGARDPVVRVPPEHPLSARPPRLARGFTRSTARQSKVRVFLRFWRRHSLSLAHPFSCKINHHNLRAFG